MKHFLSIVMLAWTTMIGAQSYTYTIACDDGKAYLGIQSCTISAEKAELLDFQNIYGSYVTSINQGSSAEQVGLQPFDYIYGVDEKRTSRSTHLTELLTAYEIGEKVTVHFIRKGKTQSKQILLSTQGDKLRFITKDDDPHLGIMQIDDLPNEIGVQIAVADNSTAKDMQLLDNDIITAINGFPIVDWQDISTAIDMSTVGEMIAVTYERAGRPAVVKAPLKSYAETTTIAKEPLSCCPFIGVNMSTISSEKARKLGFDNQYGLYVTSIIPGTAADKGGVEPFDYIYGIDEYRVGQHQSIGYILKKYEPGDDVDLHIVRNSKRRTLPITLGNQDDKEEIHYNECEEPFFGIRQNHSVSTNRGIPVGIVSSSTAEAMGLQDNDVILTINGHKMIDWTDISTAIDNMTVGKPIKVEYLRDGKLNSGIYPIKSHCDTKSQATAIIRGNSNWNVRGSDRQAIVIERLDLSKIDLEIDEITNSDVQLLRERGVSLPKTNNLVTQRMIIATRPNMGTVNLQFSLPSRGNTSIRIYNDEGRAIYEYELNNFSGAFSDQIKMSQNGVGAYFLEIKQDGKQMAKKIILKKA